MKYWSHEGKHNDLFDAIWEKYVPASGESSNEIGEVIRAFGRINYECGNNGCMNMFEDGEEIGHPFFRGDDDEDDYYEPEYEIELSQFYGEFFDTIREFVGITNTKLIDDLEEEMEMVNNSGNFSRVKVIDQVGDLIGDIILKDHPEFVKDLDLKIPNNTL